MRPFPSARLPLIDYDATMTFSDSLLLNFSWPPISFLCLIILSIVEVDRNIQSLWLLFCSTIKTAHFSSIQPEKVTAFLGSSHTENGNQQQRTSNQGWAASQSPYFCFHNEVASRSTSQHRESGEK